MRCSEYSMREGTRHNLKLEPGVMYEVIVLLIQTLSICCCRNIFLYCMCKTCSKLSYRNFLPLKCFGFKMLMCFLSLTCDIALYFYWKNTSKWKILR